jgi:hypothetical protein
VATGTRASDVSTRSGSRGGLGAATVLMQDWPKGREAQTERSVRMGLRGQPPTEVNPVGADLPLGSLRRYEPPAIKKMSRRVTTPITRPRGITPLADITAKNPTTAQPRLSKTRSAQARSQKTHRSGTGPQSAQRLDAQS